VEMAEPQKCAQSLIYEGRRFQPTRISLAFTRSEINEASCELAIGCE